MKVRVDVDGVVTITPQTRLEKHILLEWVDVAQQPQAQTVVQATYVAPQYTNYSVESLSAGGVTVAKPNGE